MRAAVVAGLFAIVAAAGAKPLGSAPDVPFYLRLPAASFSRPAAQQSDSVDYRSADVPDQRGGMSFGPIRAEAVTEDRPGGKHRTSMQYHLEGMQVLGGDIGGHLGGHGAMLTLHWH
ncbi:MAG TPA: hypothetical protein VGF56_00615 [Rhizomicrobium sp.]|jgi:hypothetical protein